MKKFLFLFSMALIMAAIPAMAADITVSAAASLTDSFREIKAAFEKDNPGTTITFNFGASGALLQQIKNGAPVDVFASADEETMDKAEKEGLISRETRTDFAANALVLIAPSGGKIKIASMNDLTSPVVKRIAVGKPESVPAGQYAKKALSTEGLWGPVSPKLIYAANVRQVLDYVKRGEVDAGFVYITDAIDAGNKVRIIGEVEKTGPITYPMAVVKDSADKKAADKFIRYVTGEKGRKILTGHGFKKPR